MSPSVRRSRDSVEFCSGRSREALGGTVVLITTGWTALVRRRAKRSGQRADGGCRGGRRRGRLDRLFILPSPWREHEGRGARRVGGRLGRPGGRGAGRAGSESTRPCSTSRVGPCRLQAADLVLRDAGSARSWSTPKPRRNHCGRRRRLPVSRRRHLVDVGTRQLTRASGHSARRIRRRKLASSAPFQYDDDRARQTDWHTSLDRLVSAPADRISSTPSSRGCALLDTAPTRRRVVLSASSRTHGARTSTGPELVCRSP